MPDDINKPLVAKIIEQLNDGEKLLDQPLESYSDRTPRQVYQLSKKIFNLYKKEIEREIQDSWKTDTRRPISRNKLVVVISHIVNQMVVPSVKAQTPEGKHDQKAARLMRDLLDFVQAKARYKKQSLYWLLEAVSAPLAVVKIGYNEAYRKERFYDESGKLSSKEILDKDNSGFYMQRIGFGNFIVPNINEENIQKQPWVIHRHLVNYETAKAIYGKHDTFSKVKEGEYASIGEEVSKTVDVNARRKVENKMCEVVEYYERGEDLYAVVINGVLIKECPINRLDKRYPFAKLGYEPLTNEAEHFYFPAMLKLKEDQELLEKSYNVIMDGMKLAANPPTWVNKRLGPKSMMPGTMTITDEEFKSGSIVQGRDYSPSLQTIQLLENSMEHSSPSSLGGIKQSGEQSRYQFQVLADNAMAPHGLFKALLREAVFDITELQISDIQQYITKVALYKIVNNPTDLDVIVIPKSVEGTRSVDKEIRFVSPYADLGDVMERSYSLYKEQKRTKRHISEVNPLALLEIDFSVIPDPEMEGVENKEQKAIKEERFFAMLRQSQYIDQGKLTERYIKTHDPYALEELMLPAERVKELMNNMDKQEMKPLGGNDNMPVAGGAIPYT